MLNKFWMRGLAIAALFGVNCVLMQAPASAKDRSRAPRNSFDPTFANIYTESCLDEATGGGTPADMTPQAFEAMMTEMCSCTLWELQDNYTQSEILSVFSGLQSNEKWATDVVDSTVSVCVQDLWSE